MSNKSSIFLGFVAGASLAVSVSIYASASRQIASLQRQIAEQNDRAEILRQTKPDAGTPSRPLLSPGEFEEIAQLRRELAAYKAAEQKRIAEELAANHADGQIPPGTIARVNYSHVGLASPADALQTWMWGLTRHDSAAFLESCSTTIGGVFAGELNEMPEGRFPRLWGKLANAKGFRIVEQRQMNPDTIGVKIYFEGPDSTTLLEFIRAGDSWKMNGLANGGEFQRGAPMKDGKL